VAWNNKGIALEAQGNTTGAIAAYARTRELRYSGQDLAPTPHPFSINLSANAI